MSGDIILKTAEGNPAQPGVTQGSGFVNFTFSVADEAEAKLILTDESGKDVLQEIPLPAVKRTGDVSAVRVEGDSFGKIGYYYLVEGRRAMDPCAKMIVKGVCRIPNTEYDWGDDTAPRIPVHESMIYKLHVRGFTKAASSGVSARGTFRGLAEKLDYIENLGFTAVELMPSYEWDDAIRQPMGSFISGHPEKELKNYWGYAQTNYYYAPKQEYSSSKDSCREFRDMVKAMHQKKMECIMEFYFPDGMSPLTVLQVIRFWKEKYRIDGFHLIGLGVPKELILRDPYLSRTKLFFEQIDIEHVYGNRIPVRRNILEYHDGFLYNARAFLKGDEGQTASFALNLRKNFRTHGVINYMANVNGFTLMDAVSYDRKHNEANGEDNLDGPFENASWNCGTEGKTKKEAILLLRKKQLRNALSYVFLAQGVPLLYAGDEFGHTQGGNNNAYALDNASGWLDWKVEAKNQDLVEFVRELIHFRKEHPMLHQRLPLHETDYLSLGYPDISYHDTKAWYCPFDNGSRSFALMYCGLYALKTEGTDNFLYLAFNSYWEKHSFALPSLPKGMQWVREMNTDAKEGKEFFHGSPLSDQRAFAAPPRSVTVLVGREDRKT